MTFATNETKAKETAAMGSLKWKFEFKKDQFWLVLISLWNGMDYFLEISTKHLNKRMVNGNTAGEENRNEGDNYIDF